MHTKIKEPRYMIVYAEEEGGEFKTVEFVDKDTRLAYLDAIEKGFLTIKYGDTDLEIFPSYISLVKIIDGYDPINNIHR